jgi:4a-hydroxytetrahydrobiopterin dehydratase
MARRTLLSEAEIAARMKEIPHWTREGKAITRTWKFNDFPPALRFINKVGELAESMNHHPDIYNSWATVRLTLTTHDRGGLTTLDFDLAKKIDAV